MRYLRFLLAVTIAFAACGDLPTSSVSADEAEAAEALALPDIRSGSDRQQAFQDAWIRIRFDARLERPQYRVIADSGQFARLWSHATEWINPKPPIPQVHFDTEMVLLAAYGVSGGGGAIEIRRVARRDDEIVVVVVRSRAGSGCAYATVVTSPAEAVVVPRTVDRVRFIVLERVRTCS